MFPLPSARTCETILPIEAGILGIWGTLVAIINGTGADTVCSFSPRFGPEGPVPVSGCCIGAFCYADRSKRSGFGSGLRTKLMGRDFRDPRACLRHHTAD